MMEEAMGITPIVLVLIIALFGFGSTRQVKTRRQRNRISDALQPLTLRSYSCYDPVGNFIEPPEHQGRFTSPLCRRDRVNNPFYAWHAVTLVKAGRRSRQLHF